MLLRGHYIRDLRESLHVTAFINANRDPKRSKAMEVEEVAVFQREKQSQTTEDHKAILAAITVALGGELCPK